MPQGIIIKGIGGFYYIKTDTALYECRARGIFRNEKITPLVGDRVNISIQDEKELKGNIEEIFPRKVEFTRPAVANIDQLVLVMSIKDPKPDLMLADKLLILANKNNIKPIIIINKLDLDKSDEHKKIPETYLNSNYTILSLSSKLKQGFEELEQHLKGKITAFAGQSGVGKSTILNTIMNSDVMETGSVSKKIGRGKHTTRHAELVELKCGGYIIDSPGFTSFDVNGIESDELELYYPEFKEFLYQCKYSRCSHIKEPDCRIKDALQQGKISNERYTRYCEIYELLKQNEKNKYSS